MVLMNVKKSSVWIPSLRYNHKICPPLKESLAGPLPLGRMLIVPSSQCFRQSNFSNICKSPILIGTVQQRSFCHISPHYQPTSPTYTHSHLWKTLIGRTHEEKFGVHRRGTLTGGTLHARLLSSTQWTPPRRHFSSSRPQQLTMTALLSPLALLFKSTAALGGITFISRVALTLLPLSLRAQWVQKMKKRYAHTPLKDHPYAERLIARGEADVQEDAKKGIRINARYTTLFLILFPTFLFTLTVLASLERTPISGRLRVLMLSPAEESALISAILPQPKEEVQGSSNTGDRLSNTHQNEQIMQDLDWVSILRTLLELEDEGVSEDGRRLLLGGPVLDASDWRVKWTESVMKKLLKGVPRLAATAGHTTSHDEDVLSTQPSPSSTSLTRTEVEPSQKNAILQPPPTKYPLTRRLTSDEEINQMSLKGHTILSKHLHGDAHQHDEEHLLLSPPKYDVLVVDRKEANAFSFGFGPDNGARDGSRGVVVVYTGFLDEILTRGLPNPELPPSIPPTPTSPASVNEVTPSPRRNNGSFLFGFLDQLVPLSAARMSKDRSNITHPHPLPPRHNEVVPSDAQTNALAVLVSHELSHLVLSHTLESYASTALLIPHFYRLGVDCKESLYRILKYLENVVNDDFFHVIVLRTIVFPFTALFGPFLNDAIGKTLNESSAASFKAFGVCQACLSRQLEQEADVVALRLLSFAGIDPHLAIDFWNDRLATKATVDASASVSHQGGVAADPTRLRLHSAPSSVSLPASSSASGEGVKAGLSTVTHTKVKLEQACSLLRTHPVDLDRVKLIQLEIERWLKYQGRQ